MQSRGMKVVIAPDPGPNEPDGDDFYDFLFLFLELLSARLYSICFTLSFLFTSRDLRTT